VIASSIVAELRVEY